MTNVKRLICIAAGVTALMIAPASARAFTVFGDPPLLSSGNTYSLPFTFLGEQVTPRLDIDGFARWQLEDIQQLNMRSDLLAPELDLETNLQITATQRIHMLFQPLDGGFQRPWVYHIHPGGGWTINEDRLSGRPAEVWYEGQPFNWLTPNDEEPLDLNLAVGRLPIFFQNGIFMNNIADAAMLGKNNIQIGNLSNLNVLGFVTIKETQGGLNPADQREQRKRLVGFESDMDLMDYFLELTYAHAYDNNFSGDFNAKGVPIPGEEKQALNRDYWAVGITRTFGPNGVAFRILGNTGTSTSGPGELFVLETNADILHTHAYANFFGSTKNWMTASNLYSAPLANESILFAPDRLLPTIGMKISGSDFVGGALGVILNPRGHTTFTPEFDYSIDNARNGNDQVGAGFQIQSDISSLLIPGDSLETLAQRGLLYGILARLTLGGIRNQNTSVAKDRFDLLEKIELIYEF